MSDEYAGWRRDRERDWYGRPEGRDEDRRWRDRGDLYAYGSGRPEQGWNDSRRDRHWAREDRYGREDWGGGSYGRDDWGGRYGREDWGRDYGGSNYGRQGR